MIKKISKKIECWSRGVRKRLRSACQTIVFMGGYYINIKMGVICSLGLQSMIRFTVIGTMLRYH